MTLMFLCEIIGLKCHIWAAPTVPSSQWERCHHRSLCQCDRGSEPQQKRSAERRHSELRLGLGLHVSSAGLRSHRHPAGPALLHRILKVCNGSGTISGSTTVLNGSTVRDTLYSTVPMVGVNNAFLFLTESYQVKFFLKILGKYRWFMKHDSFFTHSSCSRASF